MKPRAVFFDLGNTLVSYYRKEEFGPVLERCLDNATDFLRGHGLEFESAGLVERALQHNREQENHKVTPLASRLNSLFDLEVGDSLKLMNGLEAHFMAPIFGTAVVHPEAIGTLRTLQEKGIVTGLISNTPWGSPASLWNGHLQELGLREVLDHVIWCVDVGWRKPHRSVFLYALDQAGLEPEQTVFVGDDPEWDIQGAGNAGMRGVLVDENTSLTDIFAKLYSG